MDVERFSKRQEHFRHYFSEVPCTYSMTVELDVSVLRKKLRLACKKFYPTMIYGISRLVNTHEEFRFYLDSEQKLRCYDLLHPSYTIFHPESETFSCLWTAYNPDFEPFYQAYEQDFQRYGGMEGFSVKPKEPPNLFCISCIPWTSFQGFHLNIKDSWEYFQPVFTMGKYREQEGRLLLPLAIQVHHAVCDGYHTARFVNELQHWMDTFEPVCETLQGDHPKPAYE